MKYLYLLAGLCFSFPVFAQQTITGSILHNGLQRDYILYVPQVYNPASASPLILNFHGYGSNALEQFLYSDFRPIADTAGFLIVHPQGSNDQLGNPHWNVGWGLSSVNDVNFTAALIDSLSEDFNIDHDRIYSTGMSNGGFFSYKLACEFSEKIAAIASVTGSMNRNQPATMCAPEHPVPVMQIHGTSDATVPYDGNIFFEPINSVISYWKNFNQTDAVADTIQIPDIDSNDGCTAEHYIYAHGTNGSRVEHFKIIGGGHTWPGSAFGGVGTNQDIHASKEIWRFFSKYDIHGLINTTSSYEPKSISSITLFPNPASEEITLTGSMSASTYHIVDLTGRVMKEGAITSSHHEIDIINFSPGLYLLIVNGQVLKFAKQ